MPTPFAGTDRNKAFFWGETKSATGGQQVHFAGSSTYLGEKHGKTSRNKKADKPGAQALVFLSMGMVDTLVGQPVFARHFALDIC